MAAVLWDIDLEMKALKTILTPESPFAPKVYASMKPEFFHHRACKALYGRLQELLETGLSSFPTWQMLVTDTALSGEVQESLKTAFAELPLVGSDGDLQYLSNALHQLASKRAVYQTLHDTQETIMDSSKTAEDAVSRIGDALTRVDAQDDSLHEVGLGSDYNENAERVFYDILSQEQEAFQFVKTGYPTFDMRSGGHQRGNLVVIGANSGGGKSLFALNLMARQYLLGYNVVMASYEMNYHEIMVRLLAILSEVDMQRLQMKQLTVEEVRRVECAWREFNIFGKKNGNTFHLLCPSNETTVSAIGLKYRSKNPTCIIFDYINLLTSHSDLADSQWQMLGEIAKESKNLAKQMNAVVYLLAQVDENVQLRYAKAIKDHANWVMGWSRDEQSIIDGYVTVKQMKARNAPVYDFNLLTRFDIGTFLDVGEMTKDKRYTDSEYNDIQELARQYGAIFDISKLLIAKKSPLIIAPTPEIIKLAAPKLSLVLEGVVRADEGRSYFNDDTNSDLM